MISEPLSARPITSSSNGVIIMLLPFNSLFLIPIIGTFNLFFILYTFFLSLILRPAAPPSTAASAIFNIEFSLSRAPPTTGWQDTISFDFKSLIIPIRK